MEGSDPGFTSVYAGSSRSKAKQPARQQLLSLTEARDGQYRTERARLLGGLGQIAGI